MKPHLPFLVLLLFSPFLLLTNSQKDDTSTMLLLKKSLDPSSELGWVDPDPCKWKHIVCSENRVTRIQLGHQNLKGTLPIELSYLTELERLELQWNNISGPLPSLKGLSSLQVLMLSNNKFNFIPADIFSGMISLQSVELDNNPFSAWEIPETLKSASTLQNFSANSANISGKIPDFFGPEDFTSLKNLHLALNSLEGELPFSFSGSMIESLWVNGQKLSGNITVLQNMTFLKEVWLHSNGFSGPLPDFSTLKDLITLSLRDNSFTGPVPLSLTSLESLKVVNLTNNLLQGPMPEFNKSVSVDMANNTNSFCLPRPGDCDPRVETLLSIVKSMNYPRKFSENWKGDSPCADWLGITCNGENITIVNFEKMGLIGAISPDFSSLKSLQRLVLAENNLTGIIPEELATIQNLIELDVSNNHLHGKIPAFKSNTIVKTNGNLDIVNLDNKGDSNSNQTNSGNFDSEPGKLGNKKHRNWIWVVLFSLIGGVIIAFLIALAGFFIYKTKQKRFRRVQSPNSIITTLPRNSGSDNNDSLKITVAGPSETHTITATESTNDVQLIESGNMVISIQVLKNVTGNFSEENILGRGGFGIVYKGELHDGTKIAVKRMEFAGKGSSEFKSEIAVLSKVRHRHLVALLGYCLDGNEKLLVYEYMPKGTLSMHLFDWSSLGFQPLDWSRRLSIALDVARGVEYLHGLAHQSFIHRDLKPSNILLGDDMRAKVADFGLVRLAPEGKDSVETRIAGTFGYLAPEYAVTGRVTTKVDVFSFGVILMELITGRKALDESQPEDSMHLVTWFRRTHLNKDASRKSIDPLLHLDDETLSSVSTVAELAWHCCAREPYQRPDMGHAVNVLSSLVELWKPSVECNSEDCNYGIDLDMSLPQALEKWQAFEGSSSASYGLDDNTQTSIPTRPYGFAESFTSVDGR